MMGVLGWNNLVTLYVEADFGQPIVDSGEPLGPTGNANWDGATWDDGVSKWAGRDPIWTDITSSVRGISTGHSFSRQTNRYNCSSADITLDNTSGKFSPTNTGSPYRSGGYTTIGLLRRMRVRAVYSYGGESIPWIIFDGLIQSWEQNYPNQGTDATVQVSLLGRESILGAVERIGQTAQGAGESSGARVRRILNSAGWPQSLYTEIDEGETTMQATTLAGTAMNELQLVADSEGGYFYCKPDGTLVFDGYNAQIEKNRLNLWNGVPFPTLFSDAIDLFQSPINYSEIVHSYNGDLVANIISYQAVDGSAQSAASPNSRSLYGDRAMSRTDLITESDTHAARLANRDLAIYRNPELRVESVRFSPMMPTYSYDGSKTYDGMRLLAQGAIALRQGARVNHTPRGEANPISRLCFIEGVSHDITPKTWDVTVMFSSASAYANVGYSVWDGASGVNAGYFDQTRWGW